MAKNKRMEITIPDYKGVTYTLCYTPDSLKKLESSGFSLGTLDQNAVRANMELFCGAFIANHQYTPRSTREEIYYQLTEKNENGEKLMEVINSMIAEALEELNTHQGNVTWTVNR